MIKVSENITLRPLRYSDATSIAKNANNKHIWRNLTDQFPYPYTIHDALNFIELQKGRKQPEVFAIVLQGTAIGSIRLGIDKKNKNLCGDIGYWVGETYWNRGIATMSIKAIIEYGFKTYKELRCISAYVFSSNKASKRVLVKSGFKLEKTFKESIVKAGIKTDADFYVIKREDYNEQRSI